VLLLRSCSHLSPWPQPRGRSPKKPSAPISTRPGYRMALVTVTGAALLGCAVSHAQGSFDGYQSTQTVVASGLSSPWQVAVDASGNVYIADSGNNRILKETPSSTGYTQSIVTSTTLSGPEGVAVDASGNVYIGDTGNGRILKETLAGGVYTESIAVPSTTYHYPTNLAVDSSGNLYVVDGSVPFKETLSAGAYTTSMIPVGITGTAEAVAVDASGDVYVTTSTQDFSSWVFKAIPAGSGYTVVPIGTTPSSFVVVAFGIAVTGNGTLYLTDSGYDSVLQLAPIGQSFTQTTEDVNLNLPAGIAADAVGNIYVADNHNNRVVRDAITNGDFGAVNVGSSATMSLIFRNYSYSTPLGTPEVLTSGIAGLDFSDAGTGTCTTNGPGYLYAYGQACTVNVNFSPQFAGLRSGAAELNSSGTIIAFGYMHGTGSGPQIDFLPGAESTPVSGVTGPVGIAVDAGLNLYFGDDAGAVLKEAPTGGSYAQTTVATGVGPSHQVAIDGTGSVYVAEGASGGNPGQIIKAPISTLSQGPIGTATTFVSPSGIAIDGAGNVYIADNGNVIKEVFFWSGWDGATVLSGGSTNTAQITVDASGNLYIANWIVGDVVKETLSTGGYTQSIVASGLSSPSAVAVDAGGNVYIADTGNDRVLRDSPSGSTYTQTVLVTGLNSPDGLAIDQTGNLYIADSSNNRILKLDYVDAPSLTFATTPYLSTSANSPQSVTLENTGNSALSFLVPATGSNPSISSSFALGTTEASACPDVTANSATAGTLNAASSCQLSVSFEPVTVGNISGSLVLTDAASPGGSSSSRQTIALSGTAVPATPSISWSNPAAITYGATLSAAQLDATSTVLGTFTYSPAAGTMLTAGSHTLSTTFTPADSTDYTNATATVTLTVNQATPSISWTNPGAISYGTALGPAQLDATSAALGTFVYSPQAGTVLTAGSQTLTTAFTPTDSADYTTATAAVPLTVSKATPKITLTPSATSITTAQNLPVNVNVQNQVTGLAPTGTVTLTSGSYSVAAAALISGSATIIVNAGSLPIGSDTLTVSYTGDANFSAGSATAVVTVTAATQPSFSVSGTSVTVTAGATTGNTSTITVTPAGGFSGSVSLTAALASSPSGAIDPPAFSFGSTSPVATADTSSGTATLSISTVAPTSGSCTSAAPTPSEFPWAPAGGAIFAGVLLFSIPGRRRCWKAMLGMLLFLVAASSGILGCGGGNGGRVCTNVATPGTSTGTYTVIVTGTSGTTVASGTITLVVQ
jgi:sugar lactone lactonase YvrE